MSHLARTLASTLAAFAVVGALVGCARSPEPTPTPTGFASEAEAFEAAEATYRAYVDATNAQRMDPLHSPAPESFLRGELLESELEFDRQLKAEVLSIVGETVITDVEYAAIDANLTSADVNICLDSSQTTIVDESGNDVTPSTREPITLISTTVVWTPSGTAITSSETLKTGQC